MTVKTKLTLTFCTILLLFCKNPSLAQFTQIHATGLVDYCYPNCVNLEVVNPQSGYTYNWFAGIYDCSTVVSSVAVGTGTSYCSFATAQIYCMGLPPGGQPEISNPIDVRVLPGSLGSLLMPPPIASGATSCVASVNLCIPYGFYQPYPNTVIKWYLNNVLISGATSGSYLATAPGYYKYSLTSCVLALSDSILINTQPNTTINANGPLTFCAGGSVVLSVASVSGNTYQWKLNGGAVGGASNALYTASGAGSYTVTITNNGCTKTTANPIVVSVNPLPNSTISPSGTVNFCSGGQNNLTAGSGTGYGWQWLLNGTTIAGATNQVYQAQASGNYAVVTASNGCSKSSVAVGVTINTLPGAGITAGGATTFCTGGSVVLSAPVGAGYLYQWKKNGITINNAVSQTYTATASGNYKVVVTTSVGCSKQSAAAKVVTVNALPSATITPLGPTSFCAGNNVVLQGNTAAGQSYKWKKNGTYINGANSSNYTASLAGTYKIQVTSQAGCSKLSGGTVVTVPCKDNSAPETTSDFDLGIYPNPSTGDFEIDFSKPSFSPQNQTTAPNSVLVMDLTGKVVFSATVTGNHITITDEKLKPGIYTVAFVSGNIRIFRKLIKTN